MSTSTGGKLLLDNLFSIALPSLLKDHFQAVATLFSLVNPGVSALIFSNIVQGYSRKDAIRSATVAMLAVAFILALAALVGGPLLQVFGISMDAFSVAGGGVLTFIGFSMLQGQGAPSTGSAAVPDTRDSPNLGPLILFAASPGTITGVITVSAVHTPEAFPVTAILAIAIVVVVTWLVLLGVSLKTGTGKSSGIARDMTSRYMGLIVIAMGLQFVLTGYKAFMGQ